MARHEEESLTESLLKENKTQNISDTKIVEQVALSNQTNTLSPDELSALVQGIIL